eukprot:2894185-Rhodomonas_salina.2
MSSSRPSPRSDSPVAPPLRTYPLAASSSRSAVMSRSFLTWSHHTPVSVHPVPSHPMSVVLLVPSCHTRMSVHRRAHLLKLRFCVRTVWELQCLVFAFVGVTVT